jgi:hypothetical protein
MAVLGRWLLDFTMTLSKSVLRLEIKRGEYVCGERA